MLAVHKVYLMSLTDTVMICGSLLTSILPTCTALAGDSLDFVTWSFALVVKVLVLAVVLNVVVLALLLSSEVMRDTCIVSIISGAAISLDTMIS
jgi:hypothetical protein